MPPDRIAENSGIVRVEEGKKLHVDRETCGWK